MMASFEEKNMYSKSGHSSVLRDEILEYINPVDGGVYVDCTFGAGGHTRSLLEEADCQVIGVDRDPYVNIFVDKINRDYPNRFRFVKGRFSEITSLLSDLDVRNVDGMLFDLGVSSMQLETPRRGFSFSNDGPLDMRMNDEEGISAEDVVNSYNESDLAGIIFKYGDERHSRRIASAIVAARGNNPIRRTSELAAIVKKAIGKRGDTIDPSTRTFQALRMYVNGELDELGLGLEAAEKLLTPGGKLCVISFHSGEDKIVKDFLKERSGKSETFSRYQPVPEKMHYAPTFSLSVNKAIKPSDAEVARNVRSRSAKLRVATRTDAANWQRGRA